MKSKQTFLELSDIRKGVQTNGFLIKENFTRKRGLTKRERILRNISIRLLYA